MRTRAPLLFAAALLLTPWPLAADDAKTDGAETDGANASCPLHATHLAAAEAARATTPRTDDGNDSDAAAREELAARGDLHMGFPQERTVHHFRVSPQGGAVEVTVRDPADATTLAQVRTHLRAVAAAFAAGDFAIPAAVHAQVPTGVPALVEAGAEVTYTFGELPAGGRLQLSAATPTALAAVHEFLRFQIADHGTGDDPHPH